MVRSLRVAAVQVGRVDRGTSRPVVVERLSKLLTEAASKGVKLAVFPETTFSTFFPRYYIEDQDELSSYFHKEPASGISDVEDKETRAFFAKAKELGVDVAIGYGEETPAGERYNTASYVSSSLGKTVGKYRKVHLPGTVEPFSKEPGVTNQLEKRYFKPGNLENGFNAFRAPGLFEKGVKSPIVGQLICNDRRWAEGWRCLGLQGVEIVCIGYNTTAWAPQLWGISEDSMTREEAYADAMFHHKLVCQANAYTNATFLITSARAGLDDGIHPLISGSMIVSPEGHIIAENKTEDDEVVWADIDLDACQQGKTKTFAFEKHRRIEHYKPIVERAGVVEPPELD
ncbi:carbon-nitrogen hydrolase [Meredithblackwellia eburnea MCA 4105]